MIVVLVGGCSSVGKEAPTVARTRSRTVVVPDVVSMRACDALPVLVKGGVVPEATPASQITWLVVAQAPAAGRRVPRDTTEVLDLAADAKQRAPSLSDSCKAALAMPRRPG